jgi:AcrR family transcriptional regulator
MAGQRRRGEELEAALLEAAWEELGEAGFAKLTMESVAARARTGVAVLYRRWPRKDELVLATLRHHDRTHTVSPPDTGSLRDDMIAVLGAINNAGQELRTVAAAVLSGLLADTGLTPGQLRERVMGDRPSRTDEIFRRAHERGEIDLDQTPSAVLAMPLQLLRNDLLLAFEPVPDKRILEIVDDLFLPLVNAYQQVTR